MKNLFFATAALLCLAACKKSTPNNSPTPNNSLLASIHIYSPANNSLTIDTFIYDANQNMVRAGYDNIDTIGGFPYVDSGSYYFSYTSADHLPSSYLLLWSQLIVTSSPPVTQNQTDGLFYDGQGRLVKDTLVSNDIAADFPDSATWYTWSGSNIVCSTGDNLNSFDIVDSFTLNGAGNLIREADYENVQGGIGSVDTSAYTVSSYSTYDNPCYISTGAQNVGIFLLNNGIVDAVSKNLAADNIAKFNTDNSGRVISTIGSDGTITSYLYHK
jgi:hypothetical protein